MLNFLFFGSFMVPSLFPANLRLYVLEQRVYTVREKNSAHSFLSLYTISGYFARGRKTVLKILTLISGGDVGGAKTHVLGLFQALSRRIEITMVCFMEGDFARDAREMGIDVRVFPGWNLPKVRKQLLDLIREGHYDIIHSHGSRGNFNAWLLHRCGLPLLTTVHSDPKLDYMGRPAAGLIFGTMNRFALRRMDYLTGVSDSMAELMIARGFRADRVFTIYNGVDLNDKGAALPRREFLKQHGIQEEPGAVYAGIAARLNPVKDIATLIRGFAGAVREAPQLRLLIAGDGPQENELKALAEALGVADKVHFLGWVDGTDSFYAALDINTLTSLSETFPYALTEGVRWHCATVSSRVGGVPKLIDHGVSGYLFPAGDDRALAGYLAKLCHDAALRERFADALYEKTKRLYSLEATVQTQQDIYETILRQRARKDGKRDTVAVCGAYGRGNAGDEAILRSILAEIREADPDVPVCVVSRRPKETRVLHRVQAIHTFDIIGFSRLCRKLRLYLNGGGSLIQDVTSHRSLWFYLYTLRAAKRQGVPVVMYGCGIGPVTNPQNQRLAAKIISRNADVITLRESNSVEELNALGVSGPEILLAADPSLMLPAASEAETDSLFLSAGLPPHGNYAAFILRPWPGFTEKAADFARAADALAADGLTPVFLTIDRIKDVQAVNAVVPLMQSKPVLLPEDYSAESMAGLLSRMRVVVSMRLHGLIFAAGHGAPLVGIVYDPKVRAFLSYIGQENAVDLADVTADGLVKLTREAIASASPEAQRAAVERLRELEAENRRVLGRYLGENA